MQARLLLRESGTNGAAGSASVVPKSRRVSFPAVPWDDGEVLTHLQHGGVRNPAKGAGWDVWSRLVYPDTSILQRVPPLLVFGKISFLLNVVPVSGG
jgi:hypothetical protein